MRGPASCGQHAHVPASPPSYVGTAARCAGSTRTRVRCHHIAVARIMRPALYRRLASASALPPRQRAGERRMLGEPRAAYRRVRSAPNTAGGERPALRGRRMRRPPRRRALASGVMPAKAPSATHAAHASVRLAITCGEALRGMGAAHARGFFRVAPAHNVRGIAARRRSTQIF